MATLDLKIPPLAVWAVFAAAMVAAARYLPGANLLLPGRQVLAVAVALAGVALALAAVLAFRRARTTVNPLALDQAAAMVTTGVFRLSRNPMYLGMAAVLLAIALWWGSLAALVLLARFGDEFRRYSARVRRWV